MKRAILEERPENAEPDKEYADPDWLQRAWTVRKDYPLTSADEKKCMSRNTIQKNT